MASHAKKIFTSLMAAIFAVSMSAAMLLVCQPHDAVAVVDDDVASTTQAAATDSTTGEASEGTAPASRTPANNCTVTLKYYENVIYDDPKVPADEDGRFLMGVHTLTGLREGDVLDTWDYVVSIPGHFFFDAWPAKLTVSADPAENVINLFYFKSWDASFTVNYYLMLNADLTADTWAGALAPADVEFVKLGSETFDNQRFDALIEGDAYEYQLDGTYVVDTYPAQIRLTTDPAINTLNVLYVPDSMHLPDGIEVPDDYAVGDAPDADGAEASPGLPGDTEFDQDGIIEVLPEGSQVTDEVYQDFVGWKDSSTQQAGLSQTGDVTAAWIMGTAVVAIAVMGGLALLARRRTQ